MLNIKFLLDNFDILSKQLNNRILSFNIKKIFYLFNIKKKIKFEIELLQSKRNFFTKKFFHVMKEDFFFLKNIIKFFKININFKKKILNKILFILQEKLLQIPNIPHESVPLGKCDVDNKIILNWGIIKKKSFKIMDHIKFGKLTGNLNFYDVSNISGSGFVVMKNSIAFLYRSLSQFMLDVHIKKNFYSEIYVPYIVNISSLYGTGQLPKFYKDIFYVNSKREKNINYALIPTSEVSLINLFKNKILKETDLPIKLVSNTPCFRSESKSYGKNNRGLIRLKQFDKVELIQIVKPKNSMLALEKLTCDAEMILKMLNLPYRKVLLCDKLMSFSSCKTYDLEVWSPLDKSYIEVSSCSNTWDFQSRRINIRYKDKKLNSNIFVHVINGSGLAIGRILMLILENFQVDTGVIKIPDILLNYMDGLKFINLNN